LVFLAIGAALGAAAAVLLISGVASTLQIEVIHRFKIEPRKEEPKPAKKPGPPDLQWGYELQRAK
jgi:hypothetical protein